MNLHLNEKYYYIFVSAILKKKKKTFLFQSEESLLTENLFKVLAKLSEKPERWERVYQLLSKYTQPQLFRKATRLKIILPAS